MERSPVIDIYTEDYVLIWLQFEPSGEDLAPFEVGDLSIGTYPKWLDHEKANDGLNSLLGHGWCHAESGEGWVFSEGWLRWMLHCGLVPCQRFLVKIDAPEYHEYQTMDGWECDVDYNYEFITAEPLSTEESISRLEEYLTEMRAGREEVIKRMRDLKEKRRTDKEAMFIRYGYYYSRNSAYNEMVPPDGLIVSLCSKHTKVEGTWKTAWPELAQGRSNRGDREAAVAELKKYAKKAGIKLTKKDWEKVFERRRWL